MAPKLAIGSALKLRHFAALANPSTVFNHALQDSGMRFDMSAHAFNI
jgi:hypothetical protein